MADINVMRGQLARIRIQLMQMPVFSSGRPDSDEKADRQAAQLEKIAEQLQLILRDLRSGSHLAQMQLNNIKKVPPEHRWSAKQAAEQKSGDVTAKRRRRSPGGLGAGFFQT